jgi:hypothetical protein
MSALCRRPLAAIPAYTIGSPASVSALSPPNRHPTIVQAFTPYRSSRDFERSVGSFGDEGVAANDEFVRLALTAPQTKTSRRRRPSRRGDLRSEPSHMNDIACLINVIGHCLIEDTVGQTWTTSGRSIDA